MLPVPKIVMMVMVVLLECRGDSALKRER
jgi:hypothetical protein